MSTDIFVNYDGNVTWLAAAIFKSSCQMNVRYYPFDEQVSSVSEIFDTIHKAQFIICYREAYLPNVLLSGERFLSRAVPLPFPTSLCHALFIAKCKLHKSIVRTDLPAQVRFLGVRRDEDRPNAHFGRRSLISFGAVAFPLEQH